MTKIKDGFNLYESTEYVNIPEEPIEWLCHGIVGKQGKTLLIGLAKTGKTTVAIIIAISIAQGEPFLGFPTVASRVLYVVLERYRDFRRRYKEIIDKQTVPNLKILECRKPLILDSSDDKDLTLLKDTIKSWKPDFVIIDSKYRTTSKKEVDEEATKV